MQTEQNIGCTLMLGPIPRYKRLQSNWSVQSQDIPRVRRARVKNLTIDTGKSAINWKHLTG